MEVQLRGLSYQAAILNKERHSFDWEDRPIQLGPFDLRWLFAPTKLLLVVLPEGGPSQL